MNIFRSYPCNYAALTASSIHHAVYNDDYEKLQELLDNGEDIDKICRGVVS